MGLVSDVLMSPGCQPSWNTCTLCSPEMMKLTPPPALIFTSFGVMKWTFLSGVGGWVMRSNGGFDSPVTEADGRVAQRSSGSVALAVRVAEALRGRIARDARAQRDADAGSRSSAGRDSAQQIPA